MVTRYDRRTSPWLRFFGSLPIALGLALLATAVSPRDSAAQTPAAQSGLHGYWVCYEFNGAGQTDYYSAVFPYTPDNQTAAMTGFENYVATTYHEPKKIPTCPFYATEAQAKAALDQHVKIAKNKVVQTGWTLPVVPSAAATATTPAPPQAAKPAPAPATDKATHTNPTGPAHGYCSEMAGDYTVYVTPVFSLEHVIAQKVGGEFHAFIQKTYGQNASAYCPAQYGELSALTTARQHDLDEFKRNTPKTRTLKIVDVAWTPTPEAVAATPEPKPAAATPPTPALDAYQQALAAQRPKGVAAAQSMFCSADGAQRGGGKAQIYVSKVFAAASTAQAGSAFEAYLRGAHPDVIVGTATCRTAPDADTLQGTRQEYLDNQRKIPMRSVVEVDWKGGQ